MKSNHTNTKIALFALSILVAGCNNRGPSVEKIEPKFGLTRGDDKVTIFGQNLDEIAPFSIYFGDKRAEMSGRVSSEEFWVSTPSSQKAHKVDVRIITESGKEFLIREGFEYVHKAEMAECINVTNALNGEPIESAKSLK